MADSSRYCAFYWQVWFLRFSHDGTKLATGSKDSTAILWDVSVSGSCLLLPVKSNPLSTNRCLSWYSSAFRSNPNMIGKRVILVKIVIFVMCLFVLWWMRWLFVALYSGVWELMDFLAAWAFHFFAFSQSLSQRKLYHNMPSLLYPNPVCRGENPQSCITKAAFTLDARARCPSTILAGH